MLVEIKSVKEAFEKEGLDPDKIQITGVPERHISALIAAAKLFVVSDHVQPKFDVDYENRDQWKYEPRFYKGSSSGAGFSYVGCAYGIAHSRAGTRLVYQDYDTMRYVTDHPEFSELYNVLFNYKRNIPQK